MSGMGYAMMGTAAATGENACVMAAQKAISSPLMESGGVRGARGVLINITASSRLGLHEVNDACTLIGDATENDDAQVNFGVVLDESMGADVKITVIATGFVRENLPRIERRTLRNEARQETRDAVATPYPEPARQPEPTPAEPRMEPELEPEFEPVFAEAPTTEPLPVELLHEEPHAAAAAAANGNAANGTPANGHAERLFDDVDVPAIMRRSKRLIH